MDLKNAKVGYFPATLDLTAPSDRRRFPYYAKTRGIPFDIIDNDPKQAYDVIVLHQKADISHWSKLPRAGTRLVYDAIDSYVMTNAQSFKGMLRGVWKFAIRQHRNLVFSYRQAVLDMCGRADAVVCSTEEQKSAILPACKNVHIVLDVQSRDFTSVKSDYAAGTPFNFVWEGLASSGVPWALFREILEPISKRRPIALHVVTDLVYHRYGDVFYKCHTSDDAKKICGDFASNIFLYQWNPLALSKAATGADLALLPIDLDIAYQRGRPENKLLLFWRMGVPAITSATPAHSRAMARAGLEMTCATVEEWRAMVERYMDDHAAREAGGRKGMEAARTIYSEERMLQGWDEVFASL